MEGKAPLQMMDFPLVFGVWNSPRYAKDKAAGALELKSPP